MAIWVILPAFNEACNLPPLLESLGRVLERLPHPGRVVVVDDGSRDDTAAAAMRHAGVLPLVVIAHGENRGLARAVETGLRWVLGWAEPDDVIVTMDADNTHPAGLIVPMVEAVRRGADLVIASRYVTGGCEEGVPALRRALSLGIGLLMRLRFGVPGVRDYTSGYRAYRASLLRRAILAYGSRLVESAGFTVMAELLVKLRPFHPRVVEIPLHLRYDQKGGPSKMPVLRTVREYLGLLRGW